MLKNLDIILFKKGLLTYQCMLKKYFSTNVSIKFYQHIPSPRSLPLVGTLFSFLLAGGGTKLHEYIDYRHKQLGPIFKEQIGPIPSIFLNDAEDIRTVFANEGKYPKHVLPDCWLLYNKTRDYKRGLYFMDGLEWIKYRKILNHILLKEDVNLNEFISERVLDKKLKMWLINSNDGEVIELEKQLYNLSIIFMMVYILGTPFIENMSSFLPNIDKLAVTVHEIFKWSVKLSMIPTHLAKFLNLNSWKNFVSVVDECIEITSDLFDAMLHYNGNGILRDMKVAGIPNNVIQRIITDFILSAGDTTAMATLWTLYLLGRNQDVQDRLFLDLKNNDFKNVPLLKNVLKESMRLYPIAPFITRLLPRDTEIGGYLVKSGQLISMSMYSCSRNEKYFFEAEKFKPDRWQRIVENSKYLEVSNSYAALPYAMGSRSCIGKKFAHLQLLITVSKVLLMYEVHVPKSVDIKLNLITVPSEPIKLHIHKRN